MTNATMFFVQQKLQECGSRARSALARVRQATTLRQVRDFGDVHVDGVISSLKHTVPELRQLEQAKSDRARQLVDEHLKALQAVLDDKGLEEFRRLVAERHRLDWVFLRGEHAGIYRTLDRDLHSMEHRWKQAHPPAPDAAS